MPSIVQSNTRNMTTLWKQYSAESIMFSKGRIFYNMHWPHKVWLEDRLEHCEYNAFLKSVSTLLRQQPARAFVSWDKFTDNIFSSAEAVDLIKNDKSHSVVGMSLDFSEKKVTTAAPEVPLICNEVSSHYVDFWTELCGRGFGYEIDADAIHSAILHPEVSLHCYAHKNEPVGTSLIAMTGSVTGLHQIAALPNWRDKGIAKDIVTKMVFLASQNGASKAVLQTSKMGFGVYEKLGFVENFDITYYRIKV